MSKLLMTRFETYITDRYPLVDRIDSRLPEALKYFCLPNGLRLSLKKSETMFHSFVHTSEDGSHLLGCCLTFYEELTVDQFSSIQRNYIGNNQTLQSLLKLYVPKCICVISSWPFVSSFKKYLVGVYKMVTSSESNLIPIERYICNLIDDVPAPPTAGNVDIVYYINDAPLVSFNDQFFRLFLN